jgi:branched-chain amino acid transport system substrate-binding protein
MQNAHTTNRPATLFPTQGTSFRTNHMSFARSSGAHRRRKCRYNMKALTVWIHIIIMLLLPWTQTFAQEPDRKKDPIVLGMSTALTGPAAILGVNMRAGVLAVIEEVNQSGGIRGRSMKLISFDDGYEPSHTAPNMRKLIEEEQVLAVIGNVGTPTAVAAIPIANSSKTPFFGAFTGAGILRKNPPDRYIINYRASYAQETTAMVDALIIHGGLTPGDIGFFTQRDSYGDAGFVGAVAALKRHGLKDENKIIHTRYERNTLAVENALANLILAEPPLRAVIMVGAYAPCAAFIRLAKKYGMEALFLNVSFVGAEPLAEQLGELGNGVIVTQVVPHFDSHVPIVKQYRKALEAWNPSAEPSCASLEGFIATRVFSLALNTIDGTITKESIVTALESMGDFDIGLGEPLSLSAERRQACNRVWATVMQDGKIVPFRWEELKERFARK